MVQAYRLLAAAMYKLGWDYPMHLGVTEAGEGEDGRMKSAIGIGTLLADGLGDTVHTHVTARFRLYCPFICSCICAPLVTFCTCFAFFVVVLFCSRNCDCNFDSQLLEAK